MATGSLGDLYKTIKENGLLVDSYPDEYVDYKTFVQVLKRLLSERVSRSYYDKYIYVTCSGHNSSLLTQIENDNKLSIGSLINIVNNIRKCTCYSRITKCLCYGRDYCSQVSSYCSCNFQAQGVSLGGCSCNVDNCRGQKSCGCNGRTVGQYCTCNGVCTCNQVFPTATEGEDASKFGFTKIINNTNGIINNPLKAGVGSCVCYIQQTYS
jgi:hypothetical protein